MHLFLLHSPHVHQNHRSGGHSYVQLVESYRNEDGKPRQRTIATLGVSMKSVVVSTPCWRA